MITLLFTSVLILGLLAVAVYFWQKPSINEPIEEIPPLLETRSLFDDPAPRQALDTARTAEEDIGKSLTAQAAQGDKSALQKAHQLQNREIYGEVLTALVNSSQSDAQVLSLTSHVTRNEWPVNKELASAFINSWQKAPDKSFTVKMLHIAALSDDADTFRNAVELTVQFWRDGKLSDMSATELNALLNGEFWVLSTATRSSGAGFVLKRSLASARRELEQTNNEK
jgi:hypothetical protein